MASGAALILMAMLALVLAALVLPAAAKYNVSIFGCDRNGRGPPTVSFRNVTTGAGKSVGPFWEPIMQVSHGRAYMFREEEPNIAQGGIRIYDCSTDGSGCIGHTALIPNIEVYDVRGDTAAWRSFVFLEVSRRERVENRVVVDAVARCDRRNLTDCQIIDFGKALNPNASSPDATTRLMLVANSRIFVYLKYFFPVVVSCALVHGPIAVTDCRAVPLPVLDGYGIQDPLLEADAENLYGTVLHYVREEDCYSYFPDPCPDPDLVVTTLRCPFAALSLAAPFCQTTIWPQPEVGKQRAAPFLPQRATAVYKGYYLLAPIYYSYNNLEPSLPAIEQSVYIVACGGDLLKCVRYDDVSTFFGVPSLVSYDEGIGYFKLQLKVSRLGVFLWPSGTGTHKRQRALLTECRLPVGYPAQWFKPATCRGFDVLTLANIAQDFYNRVQRKYAPAYQMSKLFFDKGRSRFVAGLMAGEAWIMLNAGPPCKTLNPGCRRKSTCAALNYTCGTGLDKCGRALDCGACGVQPSPYPDYLCYAENVPNQCGCLPNEHDEAPRCMP